MKTAEEIIQERRRAMHDPESRAPVELLLRACAKANHLTAVAVTESTTCTTTKDGTMEGGRLYTVTITFDAPKVPETIRLDMEPLGVVCAVRERYTDTVRAAFDKGLEGLKGLRPHLTEEKAIERCDGMIAGWSEVVGRLDAHKAHTAEKA